jgi:hypothetical protein
MKKYISFLLSVTLLISITGCDDYLDVKPVSSITSSSFWNSPEDCEAYLVGIYNSTRTR